MIVIKTERLTLLHGEFILRQLLHQGRREIRQLQHALHVAGAEAERIANLRGGFALLCQRAESGDLFGGVHGGPLFVFGNGRERGNVVRNALHHDSTVTRKTALLRQQLQGCQPAASCRHAESAVRKGVNNQVLQQSERPDGVGQAANAVRGIRDGAHVQR